jgi:hypothetical protein
MAVESPVPIAKRDLTYVIQDAGAVNLYTPSINVGDFAYEAMIAETVPVLNNGDLYSGRRGNQIPLKCSATVTLTDPGSSEYLTLPDICEERGYAASQLTSTMAGLTDLLTLDLLATLDGSPAGKVDVSMTFPDLVFRMAGATFGDPAQYPWAAESLTATAPTIS